MGWKNVKQAYNIGHIVHVVDGDIWIGSPYVSQIFCIKTDGTLDEGRRGELGYANKDLERYVAEMKADPERLMALVMVPDSFERSLPVYTYDNHGNIILCQCEERGWPNVTHGGRLMYENTFFATPEEARAKAISEYRSAIEALSCVITETREKLADQVKWRDEYKAAIRKLSGVLEGGGPPPQCVREAQTTPPATQEPPEPEIVSQATAGDAEPTFEEATQEVKRAIKWMKRDMDFRRSQTGLDGDALSPEMQDVRRIIAEMEAGTLIVTRVRQH
jgi:hypothetical protein